MDDITNVWHTLALNNSMVSDVLTLYVLFLNVTRFEPFDPLFFVADLCHTTTIITQNE